jgi:hypothetical protein
MSENDPPSSEKIQIKIPIDLSLIEMIEAGPFEFGAARDGDCRSARASLWLGSNSTWRVDHEFWSSAILIGDRMKTRFVLSSASDEFLASWDIVHGLDPGDYRRDSHSGSNSGIGENWNRIAFCTKTIICNEPPPDV